MKKKLLLILSGIIFCSALVFAVYQNETAFKEYPFKGLKPAGVKSADASYFTNLTPNPLLDIEDVEKLCDILSRIKVARKSEHNAQYFDEMQSKYGLGNRYKPYDQSFTVTPKFGKPFTVTYHLLGRDELSAADFDCRFIAIEKNNKKIYYEVEKEDFGVLEEFYVLYKDVSKKDSILRKKLWEYYGINNADLRKYKEYKEKNKII